MSFARRTRAVAPLLVALITITVPASAQSPAVEGDYLYRVTMLRAAPGHFDDLIDALMEQAALVVDAGGPAPMHLRHSQGDHWDFMVVQPMGSFEEWFTEDRAVRERAAPWTDVAARVAENTAFHEEWFARSTDAGEMARRWNGTGLFHVEIFAGLPGQRGELLEQRRMENRYYAALDRPQNVIFTRAGGPNWDAMTIGFHADLQAFAAAGSAHSAAEQNAAARTAGFSGGTSEIGPYLRSLLSYHNDTLGVPIR